MTDPLALDTRDGLPDALRVLLANYPRAGWAQDPNFHGLVSFWLDRHLMFRRIMATLTADAEGLIDRTLSPDDYGRRLARLGQTLLGELHGHHQIEDLHYFPVLARTEPRLARGFEVLDADHQALDGHLAAFAEAANGVLRAVSDGGDARAGGDAFLRHLRGLERFLDRHLVDEEDLVVPVVLKHGERGLG